MTSWSSKRCGARSGGARAGSRACTRPTCWARSSARVVERSGIDPSEVGQVVGGCVGQVGMQATNVTRTAWLTAGLPLRPRPPPSTRSAARRSRPPTWPPRWSPAGVVDVAVACGVEVMSAVPMGATVPKDPFVGKPITRKYWEHYENTSQFEGAERIAEKFGVITRDELDAFGKQSQDRAAWRGPRAASRRRSCRSTRPTLGDERRAERHADRQPRRGPARHDARGAGRRSSRCSTAMPRSTPPGTASQISDGAGALLLMTAEQGRRARTRAEGTHRRHVPGRQRPGADAHRPDPGDRAPARAQQARRSTTSTSSRSTRRSRRWCSAWQRDIGADMARVNPNGGAIALGHPLGGTGTILLTKAVHELERTDGRTRAGHDVLRRRPRHRHHPRTDLTSQRTSRS